MPASRNYQPSRVLAQMESATKKYPKVFHPHEVTASTESGSWEMVTEDDPDVSLIDDAESVIRMVAAPISASLFEELLAPDEPRSTARPTVPLAPVVMVIPEEDLAPQSFAAILARPSPLIVPAPKRAWGVAVAAVVVVAGALALFAGVQLAKGKHIALRSPFSHVHTPEREAEHAERELLAVAPAPLALGDQAAKRPTATRGRAALTAGDLESASAIFDELTESPSTQLDGMVGLAEVSRARHDIVGAQARYREVLALSPQYLPAKLGLADAIWDGGDHDGGRKHYAMILAIYPTSMIPARVTERSK